MTENLNKELVADTSYCQLAIRIGAESLDAMIYNPMEDNSLIIRSFQLSAEGESRLREIETIIYDNPLLLDRFQKCFVEVETPDFVLVPSAITDEETLRRLIVAAQPHVDDTYEIVSNHVEGTGCRIVMALPGAEMNFLRRTFDSAKIIHNLYPLITYFRRQLHRGNTVKAFVNVRCNSADLVVMAHDRLFMANRFTFRTIDDLSYYILASTEHAESPVNEVYVVGHRPERDELIKSLRRFREPVMPLIFPSAIYRAGKISLSAPFDLVIIPLCD